MKILLFSDVHWSKNSSIVNSRGEVYSERLEQLLMGLNWVNKLAIDNKCELMICAGDMLEDHCVDEELTALQDVKWAPIDCLFLCGNHDSSTFDLRYSTTKILENSYSRYSHKVISELTSFKINDFQLHFIPYIRKFETLRLGDYIKDVDNSKKQIIISHNDLSGVSYGGYLSKTGFCVDDIDKHCDLFLNGHIHNSMWVSNKILNLGSLSAHNFTNDSSIYKYGCWILDTDTLNIAQFENPYAFKFFKFDILLEEDLEKYKNFFQPNSIVSVKVLQSLSEKVKEFIHSNKNIIKSRITIIPEISNTQDNTVIISKDHIQQFKEYILENVGCDDIIQEELGRL